MPDHSSPLADTEVHFLRADGASPDSTAAERKIFVGHCGSLGAESPVPVLVLTDANGMFGGAVDLVRSLQLARHLPPMLVVGIGYRLGAIAETMAPRSLDLTPTADADFSGRFLGGVPTGGAAALTEFISSTLRPWLAEHHPVDLDDMTYFGHSLGGLFGTHLLFDDRRLFRRYVIGSPSLWWNSEVMFDVEAAFAQRHHELAADVFFGIGALETHEGRQREQERMPPEIAALADSWHLDMVADMDRFVGQLRSRNHEGLRVESVVFPDEFHITVPFLTLSRGLRWAFDAPR